MFGSGLVFATSHNYVVLLLAAMFGVITPSYVTPQRLAALAWGWIRVGHLLTRFSLSSGNEIGPFRPIEESILAQLTEPEDRSTVYAWYFTLSGLALALGNLTCGWSSQALQDHLGWSPMSSFRFMFCIYAAAGLFNSVVAMALSRDAELQPTRASADEQERLVELGEDGEEIVEEPKAARGLSPETKKKVWLLSALFGVDNLAGGLVPV